MEHSEKEVSIHVQKFSLKEGRVKTDYQQRRTLIEGETLLNPISAVYKMKPTGDFKAAVNRLKAHFVRILCVHGAFAISLEDHYKAILECDTDENYPYDFKNYLVFGVSVRDEGFVIMGGLRLKGNRVVSINTPFMRYEDAVTYENISEAQTDVEDAIGECEAYIEGKFIIHEQLELFAIHEN